MGEGFDCATKLNATSAKNLKNAGFEYVMRYLPTTAWKGLTKDEVKAIQNAGLKLVSIFQRSANYAGYFTYEEGKKDGVQAKKLAESLGQPKDTAIYFAVDYDAQPKNIVGVLAYFKGIKETLRDYKIGVYGSYRVMNEVMQEEPVDYYWQTYAWSRGKVADHIHMHQYQNGVTVAGVQIDRNDIKKEPGAWNESVKETAKKDVPKKKKRTAKNGKYTVVAGDTLSEIAADFGVTVNQLVQWNNIKDKNLIRTGQILQVQKPKTQSKNSKSNTTTYKIKPGDTLSGIAKKFGTTVQAIRDLNNISNPNKIYAGDTIKIPAKSTKKATYHTVKSGDTVSALALKYGSTQAQIKNWNNLKDVNKIDVGQRLRVK